MTRNPGEDLDEDYDSIYNAVSENTARLQYWIGRIYWQHGIRNLFYVGDSLTSQFHCTSFEGTNPIVSLRYLVLELWNFNELYRNSYSKIMKNLDLDDLEGLHSIINGNEKEMKLIDEMRDKFVAHREWTLSDAADMINKVKLYTIVRYARIVRLFQDAVFRTMHHKHYRAKAPKHDPIFISTALRSKAEIKSLSKKYGSVKISIDSTNDDDKYILLHDSLSCLGVLYENFDECALAAENKSLETYSLFNREIYNAKYMILEMHNIIQFFKEMNISMPFKPGFMKREKEYQEIRTHYCVHPYLGKIKSFGQLLHENRILLSNLIYDIEEVGILFMNLPGIFLDRDVLEIRFMITHEILDIDRVIEDKRVAFIKFYNFQFAEDAVEQDKHHIQEQAKKNFCLD